MRTLTMSALVLLLASPVLATPPEIVIFDSVNDGVRPAVDAATFIGANVHAYASGQEAAWIADVQDGADMVVFDCNSNYTTGPSQMLVSLQLDAISTYLNTNPCGRAVVALWFMAYEAGNPLWSLMDITYCSDYYSTIPIYQWAYHGIWAGIPNPIRNQESWYYVDGAKVEPMFGATPIGGFTTSVAPCEAGLVINHDSRTVYIGETGRGGTYDDDADGVRDWEELYRNIFNYLLTYGPSATEGATWGQIKSLYH